MSVIDNAREKVKEALFFLALLDRVEGKRAPLTQRSTADEEFVFLLSALLNACYSAKEHLKIDNRYRGEVASFVSANPEFYASGSGGGWRTRAVHFQPVKPMRDGRNGYIPPPGDNVVLRFKDTEPNAHPNGDSIVLDFGEGGAYYFTDANPQNSIGDVCNEQIIQLNALIDRCASIS